ncbi:unnamed protein product, partial [Staurois parvus]
MKIFFFFYTNCFYTHKGCKSNHFFEKYCESCGWSKLVTWYKAVVSSLVPCDLCDHSQISHV